MPRLSRVEKEQVEDFARRQAAFLLAMTEGDDKLRDRMSQKDVLKLHKEIIMEGPCIESPEELSHLGEFIESLEKKVEEHREKDTPRDLMEMIKVANAGVVVMNNHMKYNHPRLVKAVNERMTEIHHTAYAQRLDRMGLLLPDGRVKMGDQVSAEPIGYFRPQREYPNYFNPPDDFRDPAKWRRITFDEFKNADNSYLFNNIFFVEDSSSNGQDYTAFELVSCKYTASGTVYEIRWEETSYTTETISDELEELAEAGLWTSPKPPGPARV